MPIDRMWIIRALWLVGMIALVGLVVVGFVLTMRDPSLIDIPAFTGIFTSLGLSLQALIVVFLVVPAVLSIVAAVWMFLGAKTQWFPLLFGLGLVAQNAYSSGFTLALPPTPGWQTAAAYIETAAMTLVVLIVFLFPNGRFVPRWSRWVALATIGTLAFAPPVAGTWRRMLIAPDQTPSDQWPTVIVFAAFAFTIATIA
jgi:hypothetical protein